MRDTSLRLRFLCLRRQFFKRVGGGVWVTVDIRLAVWLVIETRGDLLHFGSRAAVACDALRTEAFAAVQRAEFVEKKRDDRICVDVLRAFVLLTSFGPKYFDYFVKGMQDAREIDAFCTSSAVCAACCKLPSAICASCKGAFGQGRFPIRSR